MSGKIAAIDHEFSQVSSQLKSSHQELVQTYQRLIKEFQSITSSSGPFYSDQVSPKVQGLTEGINSDVIARMEAMFEQTEELIENYETIIVNVDTSC